ncbi:MAG: hypothetical protein QOG62_213 [Thermoleophilaceae bacterium]|nr:hypothetical protein [Thermoleophilaceae bacterium]
MFRPMEGGVKSAQDTHAVDASKLLPAEYYGFVAALVLFASLFLPWFTAGPPNGQINGHMGTFNAWQTFGVLDYVLAAACLAPFVLAWIIIRGHKLTWRPGEVTMIIGLVAFTLIMMNGIILGKPGDPQDFISRDIGYWVALIGAAGIVVSGFLRQSKSIKGRRPPGSVN